MNLGFKPKTARQWIIFLAASGIVLSSPFGARIVVREIKRIISKKLEGNYDDRHFSVDAAKLSQALYVLKKRKIIKLHNKEGKTALVLTEKGKRRKLEYDLEEIKIPDQNKWDGKWRFLMFDVPESHKTAREALRKKLKDLGFMIFQKSIWVHPFPCRNEIDFIAEIFKIGPYINLLTVQLEDDKPLRDYFGL